MNKYFNSIEEAIADIKRGKMVIVVDDEQRENEGDLIMAAEFVEAEYINFMVKNAGGLICTPMTGERLRYLNLRRMVENNTDLHGTAFTISVDSNEVTTGISAMERAKTIKKLISSSVQPSDFKRPGHIFPLEAKNGGVLERPGHTEAAIDLVQLAGLFPAGVICEIMNEDGSMARLPDLIKYKEKHKLKLISIAALIEYRRSRETLLNHSKAVELPTEYGMFMAQAFKSKVSREEHIVLTTKFFNPNLPVLVRVHSECITGDVFKSIRCDCGEQKDMAMQKIAEDGNGIMIYLRQEGRGIGLVNKLKTYKLQEAGMDTVEANEAIGFAADLRDYKISADILNILGIQQIRLLTNNPDKIKALTNAGIDIIERVHIEPNHNEKNAFYMATKFKKMGHLLKKADVRAKKY
jgi:3,4-dihydroxy 2-butanone 4-phosphate synthase/GTP cyclohydrolase II